MVWTIIKEPRFEQNIDPKKLCFHRSTNDKRCENSTPRVAVARIGEVTIGVPCCEIPSHQEEAMIAAKVQFKVEMDIAKRKANDKKDP